MEERILKVDRRKAIEWYEKGGDLKSLALSIYKEEELRPTLEEEIDKDLKNNNKWYKVVNMKLYDDILVNKTEDRGNALWKFMKANEFLLKASVHFNEGWHKKTSQGLESGFFIKKDTMPREPSQAWCGPFTIGEHQRMTVAGTVYFKRKSDAIRVMKHMYATGMLEDLFSITK